MTDFTFFNYTSNVIKCDGNSVWNRAAILARAAVIKEQAI